MSPIPVMKPHLYLIAGLALLLGGCNLSSSSSATNYYVLTAPVGSSADTVRQLETSIGVEIVTAPEYLRRSQMVSRFDGNRLMLNESNRWAEPLEAGVSRVLRKSLSRRLPNAEVVDMPWTRLTSPQFVYSVSIYRFEVDTDRKVAVLDVGYTQSSGQTRAVVTSGQEIVEVAVEDSKEPGQQSDVLARALDQFADILVERL